MYQALVPFLDYKHCKNYCSSWDIRKATEGEQSDIPKAESNIHHLNISNLLNQVLS
jgi:hypothetical protein